ncbi:unnamed protein product, partial [Urochloa humidicola]
IWIDHPYPKRLQICDAVVHDNFITANHFCDELIDVVIRRFNQLDISIVDAAETIRWRHFLESDFATLCIGGYPPHEAKSILHQFVHVDYSVPRCTMIIAPVLVDSIWCAYMFDIHANKVHILDPAHTTVRGEVHKFLSCKLIDALCECAVSFLTTG